MTSPRAVHLAEIRLRWVQKKTQRKPRVNDLTDFFCEQECPLRNQWFPRMNKLRKELWGNECYNHKTVAGWRKKGVRTTKNSSLREKILYFAKKLRVCVCWWVLQTFPSQPHVKAISDPFRVASSWDVRKISTKKRNEQSDRVRNSQIVNFMAFNKFSSTDRMARWSTILLNFSGSVVVFFFVGVMSKRSLTPYEAHCEIKSCLLLSLSLSPCLSWTNKRVNESEALNLFICYTLTSASQCI